MKTRSLLATFVLPVVILLMILSGPLSALAKATLLRTLNGTTQPQSQSVNVERVGQIGGPTYAVAVLGNYVYVGAGPRLVILDVSDPAHPTQAGFYNLPAWRAYRVTVAGNWAYVAADNRGLRIINISDPTNPIEVGFYNTPTGARGIDVAENYAYVVDESNGLYIVDISDPANPTGAGFCFTGGRPQDVAVAGNYAYVLTEFRLYVINVADPADPIMNGSYSMPSYGYGVAVAGDRAYVAAYSAGLRIIDISDPANPTEVGFYDTPGYAMDVAVVGNYAYVADGDTLRVINISPANPIETGFYDVPGCAQSVAVVGNYAYIGDGYNLWVIYVADPTHPIGVGFYPMPGAVRYSPMAARDVAMSGNYVYVADGDGGLVILRFLSPVSTFMIPIGGGSFISPMDHTEYIFPANTFTDTVIITYTPVFPKDAPSPGSLIGINHFFKVTAVYSSTGQPAQLASGQTYTITVRYTDAEEGPAIEETLALYYWDGSQWVRESSSEANADTNTVIAYPGHLSLWAVLGETRRMYLPLMLKDYRYW